MPAPKGHPPYPGCEKGALHGYLGKPEDAYTEEDIKRLGQEMIDWFYDNPQEMFFKEFFLYRGIKRTVYDHLYRRYPSFREYHEHAKEIQEIRLLKYPFWKKADGAHARFILARHHEGYKDMDQEESSISSKAASRLISNLLKNKDPE
jgi:hypothetical protein